MKTGIALYSVRETIKEKGLAEVLKLVRRAGFEYVEFAGFYGYTPVEVKGMLRENGLSSLSAHVGIEEYKQALPYLVECGVKTAVIPYIGKEEFDGDIRRVIDKVKEYRDFFAANGIECAYHNHAHEYGDGQDRVAELLLAVDGLKSQLDVFWACAAGKKPTESMKKYGDRLWCLHIKEMDATGDVTKPNPVIGEGIVGAREIYAQAAVQGIGYAVLEAEGFPCPVEEYLSACYKVMARSASK